MVLDPPAARGADRLLGIDGLRTFAVLLVFLSHLDEGILRGGQLGVDLFFVVSGLVITRLLLLEHRRTGRVDLLRFQRARFLRLFPALAVLSVVTVPVQRAFPLPHAGTDALLALTYLTDAGVVLAPHASFLLHTWTLAVEQQFYLVWPLLLLTGLRVRHGTAVLGGAAVVLAVALTAVAQAHGLAFYYLPTTHVPSLAAGAALAVLTVSPRSHRLVERAVPWPLATAALVAIAGAAAVASPVYGPVPSVVVALVAGLPVAHLATARGGPLLRVASLRPLVWLGQRSYAFYLWHYAVVVEVGRRVPDLLVRLPVALLLTLGITQLSWVLVERPVLDRWRGRARVSTSGPVAPPVAGR